MRGLSEVFKESDGAGYAQYKWIREAVLRRCAVADAWGKAEDVEARVMQNFAEQLGDEAGQELG
jgi:hypothetical protein